MGTRETAVGEGRPLTGGNHTIGGQTANHSTATTEGSAWDGMEGLPVEMFIVSCILCGVGAILTSSFLLFNIKYRNTRIIRMSSPNMNILLLVGSYLTYLTCIMATLGGVNSTRDILLTSCQSQAWVLALGFTLIYGAMLTKSWRVRKIFLRGPQKKVVIKDHILLAIIVGLLAGDVLILTLWQAIDPLKVKKVTEILQQESPDEPDSVMTSTHEVMTCRSRYSSMWMTSLFMYKTFILLYGTYLSWAVRAVTLPAMNDSTAIILSSLLTSLLSMVTSVISVWFRHVPEVTSSVLLGAVWLCTTITLCLNFVPKMRLVWQHSEDELVKVSMLSQVIYSPNQSIDQVEEEIYHLVAENRGLKKSLSQKEMKIKVLQEHVTSAREKLENLFIEEKQDSGLDADMSSSSNHDDDTNPAVTPGVSTVNQAEPYQQPDQQPDQLPDQLPDHQQYPQQNKHYGLFIKRCENGGSGGGRYVRSDSGGRSSLRSLSQAWLRLSRKRASSRSSHDMSSCNNLIHPLDEGRLRHSLGDLVHELDTVDYLSSTLCESLQADVSNSRIKRSSLVYDQVRAKQDITGSIVDSYDLDDLSDTYSYVSNHLTTAHTQPLRYHKGYYYDDGESYIDSVSTVQSMRRVPSSESLSTIPNDKYYPTQGKLHKRGRRTRKLGRRNSWKREPKPKIFTVFGPKAPSQANVAKAGVRILYEEGTYV